MSNRDRHDKRRKMLKRREARANTWLYTDDKPKTTAHPVIVDDLMRKFLYPKRGEK